jgi:hypothetical protein
MRGLSSGGRSSVRRCNIGSFKVEPAEAWRTVVLNLWKSILPLMLRCRSRARGQPLPILPAFTRHRGATCPSRRGDMADGARGQPTAITLRTDGQQHVCNVPCAWDPGARGGPASYVNRCPCRRASRRRSVGACGARPGPVGLLSGLLDDLVHGLASELGQTLGDKEPGQPVVPGGQIALDGAEPSPAIIRPVGHGLGASEARIAIPTACARLPPPEWQSARCPHANLATFGWLDIKQAER